LKFQLFISKISRKPVSLIFIKLGAGLAKEKIKIFFIVLIQEEIR